MVALDLASLASVARLCDKLLKKGELFDVIIANAGRDGHSVLGHTTDGFETQFGTNHLGHFAFINRIASLIRTGGRLITCPLPVTATPTSISRIPTLNGPL